jgi:hypothetical protein
MEELKHEASSGVWSEMRTYAGCDRRGAGCLPSVAPSLSLSRTTVPWSPRLSAGLRLVQSRGFLLGDARASEQRRREADTWALVGRGQGRRVLRGGRGISCFLIPALAPSFSSRGSLEKVLPQPHACSVSNRVMVMDIHPVRWTTFYRKKLSVKCTHRRHVRRTCQRDDRGRWPGDLGVMGRSQNLF